MRRYLHIALLGLVAWFGAAGAEPKTPTYGTAQEALDALVQASANGIDAIRTLLGPGSADVLRTGDEVEDKRLAAEFNRRAHEKAGLQDDPIHPEAMVVVVGEDEWPFAIPLVRKNGRWSFDIQEGRREIRRRVIGSNELDAIEVCKGYVEAQFEYAEQDRDGNGIREYAQRIASSSGKHDGLYWPGEDSPVAEGFARAFAEGYTAKPGQMRGYRGYLYRILKSQGPDAAMGEQDYVVQGHMIGGFALIAWPAEYGVSGIKSFIVNQDGVVYEKDLGPQTASAAKTITRFNPDKSWRAVE